MRWSDTAFPTVCFFGEALFENIATGWSGRRIR